MPPYTSESTPALHSNTVPSALDIVALYAVPLVAGGLAVGVFLGPAKERPAVGARVFGYVTRGTSTCALRVQLRQHRRGAYAEFEGATEVRVEQGGVVVGSARTELASIADVVIPLAQPASDGLALTVTSGALTLASVPVALAPTLASAPIPMHEHVQRGVTLRVGFARGVAVPELPERLRVSLTAPAAVVAPALRVDGVGADIGPSGPPLSRCGTGRCEHVWELEVTGRAPTLQLELSVGDGGVELTRWAGVLPFAPGLAWLDASSREALKVHTSVPREVAFVSLFAPEGRVFGGRVPLTTSERGVSTGELALPPLPAGPVVARVSSELDEPDAATLAWPLDDAVLPDARTLLLGDGLPGVIEAERERRARARWPAFLLLFAAALFEIAFLWWRARRAQRRLALHLAEEGAGGEAVAAVPSALPLTALVLLSGALALGFAVLALVAALG